MTRITATVSPTDAQLLDAVRLGEAMWANSPVYGNMARDVDKMIEYAYHARADAETFFHVAVDRMNRTCGFLIGSIAPYGFHTDKFAYDRLVYVAPDARGLTAARALILSFEAWAREHGAARILLGITTGAHTEQIERFYNKMGYASVGRLTMKEVN
jgi:GNAT superfamily N-acetyltransferase